MLHSVDYERIKHKRRSNFEIYDSLLFKANEYQAFRKNDVPLCYPLVANHQQLRDLLKNQKEFTFLIIGQK